MPRKKSRRGRPKKEKPPPDENPYKVEIIEEWRYALDERILVEYEGDLYRAVIQKRRIAHDGYPEYRIHYEKYRKTWDEWIDNREGLPRTKANLKQMVEESKKKTALRNEEKKAKALADKLKKQQKLLKASQKSEVKKKRGRPPGKKSSKNSNPQESQTSQKKSSNKTNSNNQAVRKRSINKSTNELPKCVDKNKNSALPVEPAPKKRGRSRKRPSTSKVEGTQPKKKKNKSTSTDDLTSSIAQDQIKNKGVRSRGGKLDKKNKKTVKNNSTKKLNNPIPAEQKLKKKRGRKPKKKEDDEKPIDKESIIQSTKNMRVILKRLDLSDYKHLKISIYNPNDQQFQNERNASNSETTEPKIDEILKNDLQKNPSNKSISADTATDADKPAFKNIKKPKVNKIGKISRRDRPSTSKAFENSKSTNNLIATHRILQLSSEYLPIEYPDILFQKLMKDEMLVNEQNQVVQYPNIIENTIPYLVKRYVDSIDSFELKLKAAELGVILLNYFNSIIFDKIMYPYEKKINARNHGMVQFLKHYRDNINNLEEVFIYHAVLRPKKVWSSVCGPTHLLRIFQYIPPNVADFVQSKTKITGITKKDFQKFLCFMAENFKSIFENESYLSYYDVIP